MTYKTNNDILRAKYGDDYEILLRAIYHKPEEKTFQIKRIVLNSDRKTQKREFETELLTVNQRLKITRFGPIIMAQRGRIW